MTFDNSCLRIVRVSAAVFVLVFELIHGGNLDLSHTGLSGLLNITLFNGVDLTNITTLNLSSNSLTGFTNGSVLSAFPSLEVLDLSQNSINEIPAGLFSQLFNLRSINLAYNRLVVLPDLILNNTACEILNLNHNQISLVKNVTLYNQQSSLKYLDLSSNRILNLDENAFKWVPTLSILKLNNNSLTQFADKCFQNLHNLSAVEFSMNFFTKFPRTALFKPDLESLTTILAAENAWESFSDDDLIGGQSLRNLDISGHTVRLFSPHAFSDLRSLQHLNFRQSKVAWLPPFLLANLTSYNTSIYFNDWPSLVCAPYMPPRCSVCSSSILPICPFSLPAPTPSPPTSTSPSGRSSISPVNLQFNIDLNFTLTKIWSSKNISVDLKIELSQGFDIDSTILIILPASYDVSRNRTSVATRIRSTTNPLRKQIINKINNDLIDPSSTMRAKPILQTLDSDSISVLQYCSREGTVAINRFEACPADAIESSSDSSNNSVLVIVGIIIGVVIVIFFGAVLREVIMKIRGPIIPKTEHRVNSPPKGQRV